MAMQSAAERMVTSFEPGEVYERLWEPFCGDVVLVRAHQVVKAETAELTSRRTF